MNRPLLIFVISCAIAFAALSSPCFADDVNVLMTSEEPPLFMAVGRFDPGCRLNVVEALDIIMPEQSSDYTTAYYVEVIGYTGEMTLKIYSPSGGRAYIQRGIYWDEVDTGQDEEYMTIDIESGTMIAYSSGRPLRSIYVIIIISAVLLTAIGGSALLVYGTGSVGRRLRGRRSENTGR